MGAFAATGARLARGGALALAIAAAPPCGAAAAAASRDALASITPAGFWPTAFDISLAWFSPTRNFVSIGLAASPPSRAARAPGSRRFCLRRHARALGRRPSWPTRWSAARFRSCPTWLSRTARPCSWPRTATAAKRRNWQRPYACETRSIRRGRFGLLRNGPGRFLARLLPRRHGPNSPNTRQLGPGTIPVTPASSIQLLTQFALEPTASRNNIIARRAQRPR